MKEQICIFISSILIALVIVFTLWAIFPPERTKLWPGGIVELTVDGHRFYHGDDKVLHHSALCPCFKTVKRIGLP